MTLGMSDILILSSYTKSNFSYFVLRTAIVLKSSDLIPTLSVHHVSASHQKWLGHIQASIFTLIGTKLRTKKKEKNKEKRRNK